MGGTRQKLKTGTRVSHGDVRRHEICAVEAEDGEKIKDVKCDGSGITFAGDVPGYVQSSLMRRLHHLGRPRT